MGKDMITMKRKLQPKQTSLKQLKQKQNSDEDDPLNATFYYTLTNQQIDVAMELEGKIEQSFIPQRYVLVIDVSESMDYTVVEGDPRSLLERIKTFAKLFINHVSENTFLSIVDFSDEARILLTMTLLNDEGKKKAIEVIEGLQALSQTNLCEGLLKGLEATQSGSNTNSYDCIILFTDGEANIGVLDPNVLIEKCKTKMENLNRINKVQLATITIGKYRPSLLKELSRSFGSDAFSWLDIKKEFESDMLIPLLIRQNSEFSTGNNTIITDLSIDLVCLNRFAFVSDSASTGGLQNPTSKQKLSYVILNLLSGKSKTISFGLNISNFQTDVENEMLKVKITYLDHKLQKKEKNLTLELDASLLLKYKFNNVKMPGFILSENIMMKKIRKTTNKENAHKAFANVMKQKSLQAAVSAINQALQCLDKDKELDNDFDKHVNKIVKIKTDVGRVLGKASPFFEELCKLFKQFDSNLYRDRNWCRLAAMESSLDMQMPSPVGVFIEENQNFFMPQTVATKLKQFVKVLDGSTLQTDCSTDQFKDNKGDMQKTETLNKERLEEQKLRKELNNSTKSFKHAIKQVDETIAKEKFQVIKDIIKELSTKYQDQKHKNMDQMTLEKCKFDLLHLPKYQRIALRNRGIATDFDLLEWWLEHISETSL